MNGTESRRGAVGGIVMMSLIPGSNEGVTERDDRIAQVSLALQGVSIDRDRLSLVTLDQVGEWAVDRMTEILGRLGSAGEQLGLAVPASRDARRWMRDTDADPDEVVVAVRAHAEMVAYWSLGSAHGLGNVLLRMLALNPNSKAFIDTAYSKANGFEPFSEDQKAWEPFGKRLLDNAKNAAMSVSSPSIDTILTALSELEASAEWDALMAMRGQSFHRWRPQSESKAIGKQSPLVETGVAGITLWKAPLHANVVPDHQRLLDEADAGLDALTNAALALALNFHGAIVELGLPIFQPKPATTA